MQKTKKTAIQIYLEPEQAKIISILSRTSGKSKASIIRSCISNFLANLPLEKDPAWQIMNLGASDKEDISEKHDDYLISFEK